MEMKNFQKSIEKKVLENQSTPFNPTLVQKLEKEGLGWVLVLRALEMKGFTLEYYYRNEIEPYDQLMYWNYDPQLKGMAPERPEEVRIYDQGKLAGILKDRGLIDPDVETSLELFDLIKR